MYNETTGRKIVGTMTDQETIWLQGNILSLQTRITALEHKLVRLYRRLLIFTNPRRNLKPHRYPFGSA